MSDKKLTATLPTHCIGSRLDKALSELFTDYSRSFLKHCLIKGSILVDGDTARASDKVLGGEQISFELPAPTAEKPLGEALPLDIVFEDEHLLVVNKQAGVVVHPAAGHHSGTLLNALLHRCPGLVALPRCGIVHRLDKDTSGLLAIAKTREAHWELVKQLQNKEMGRRYVALARGQFISGGSIAAAIGRHPVDRKRMAVVQTGGKAAITHYRIAHRYASHTRLDITLETGRTHQIRVHLSHIHHPLLGDTLYGGAYRPIKGWQQQHLNKLKDFNRQALHANQLSLKHPHCGEWCHYQSDLPDDMKNLFGLFDENEKSTTN